VGFLTLVAGGSPSYKPRIRAWLKICFNHGQGITSELRAAPPGAPVKSGGLCEEIAGFSCFFKGGRTGLYVLQPLDFIDVMDKGR